MLDSIGSTLTDETLTSYWQRFHVDPSTDELTVNQLIQCFESELHRPSEAKQVVRPDASPSGSDSSDEIPSLDLLDRKARVNAGVALDEMGPDAEKKNVVPNGESGRPLESGNQVPVAGEGQPINDEDDLLEEEDEEEDDDVDEGEAKERIINVKVSKHQMSTAVLLDDT